MVSEALRVEKNRPVGYGPPFRVTAGLTRQSDAAKKTAFDRHAKIGETLRRLMRLLVNSGFSGPVCFLLADLSIVRQGKRKVKAVQKIPLGAIIERSTTHRRVQ